MSKFVILLAFITGILGSLNAQEHGATTEEHPLVGDLQLEAKEDGFDAKSVILHHIADAHEFHIAGDLSLPLPVILWTEEGLVTFMSSEFHHDDAGTHVVSKGSQKFVKFHEKIYYASNQANSHGSFVNLDEEHHPSNAQPLDFSITKNVFSLFFSIFLLLLIFLGSAKAYSSSKYSGVPRGIARFTEPLVLFVRDEIAEPFIGKKYKRYLPFLLTIFFFIWLNNIIGLIPFFPFSANLSGNIAFTFALACITFLIVNFSGNKNYWKHIFWMPDVPVPMKIFLAPIEVIGMFTKPISLFIRLFANITAGHIVVLALISLVFFFKVEYGEIAGWGASPVSVAFVVFISLIEILVTAIQAYIFTVLSALYIGMAVEEHH